MSAQRPSDLYIDEKWDRCIDLTLKRSIYGGLAGAATALTLFRSPASRAAALAFGFGAGFGSAYTDCAKEFEQLPKLPS